MYDVVKFQVVTSGKKVPALFLAAARLWEPISVYCLFYSKRTHSYTVGKIKGNN